MINTHTLVDRVIFYYQDMHILRRNSGLGQRRQSLYRALADVGSPCLKRCMWEYDWTCHSRVGEACLSTFWLVDNASGLDVEHKDAPDAGFAVNAYLSSL
jgi:hypothetical protein